MPDLKITQEGFIIDELDSGIDFLAGLVVDNLINTLSTDLYSPDFGTNLKSLPKFNIISKSQIQIELTQVIERIKLKIIEEQINNPIPDESEMLEDILINDVFETIDPKTQNTYWELDITVYSKSGANKNVITDQIIKQ